MTTAEILNLYGISFINEMLPGRASPTKNFVGGGAMEILFFFVTNPRSVEEDLLPVIDHHLNGNTFPIDDGLSVEESYIIQPSVGGVEFIDRATDVVEQTVPFADFRAIAQAWADFNRNVPFA